MKWKALKINSGENWNDFFTYIPLCKKMKFFSDAAVI